MRLLFFLLVVSAIIHFLAVFFMPSFGFFARKTAERQPAYVEVRQIEIPKPKPPKKAAAQPKPVQRAAETADKPVKTPTVPTVPAFVPAEIDEPKLPDISVPKSLTEAKPEIAVPDIIGTPEKKNPDTARGASIEQEFASLEAGKAEREEKERFLDDEIKAAEKTPVPGQIYSFDEAPTSNRRVVSTPKNPEFNLANDTKVTLKFSINKDGSTSDIIVIKGSTDMVNRMAYEFVQGMRFDAVIHDEKDTAKMTITFTVRQ